MGRGGRFWAPSVSLPSPPYLCELRAPCPRKEPAGAGAVSNGASRPGAAPCSEERFQPGSGENAARRGTSLTSPLQLRDSSSFSSDFSGLVLPVRLRDSSFFLLSLSLFPSLVSPSFLPQRPSLSLQASGIFCIMGGCRDTG